MIQSSERSFGEKTFPAVDQLDPRSASLSQGAWRTRTKSGLWTSSSGRFVADNLYSWCDRGALPTETRGQPKPSTKFIRYLFRRYLGPEKSSGMNMRPELSPVGIKGGISQGLSVVASLAAAVLVLTASSCAGIVSKTQATGIAALTASTANLTFGTVQVGSSIQQTLTLTNSGTASLTISQISVSGTGFADSAPATPLTLTAG